MHIFNISQQLLGAVKGEIAGIWALKILQKNIWYKGVFLNGIFWLIFEEENFCLASSQE